MHVDALEKGLNEILDGFSNPSSTTGLYDKTPRSILEPDEPIACKRIFRTGATYLALSPSSLGC